MYPFGRTLGRKQKHPNDFIPGEYLLLGSEPVVTNQADTKLFSPDLAPVNRYFARRRVMRNIKRLRQEHSN